MSFIDCKTAVDSVIDFIATVTSTTIRSLYITTTIITIKVIIAATKATIK